MPQGEIEKRQTDVNDLIEAFETAHAEQGDVNLTEFMPAQDHPLYLEVRRELLRVDLELSWQDGIRRHFEDYAERFPDLLQDRATLQDLAYEEYRLRALAGEAPTLLEYEKKYGVSTAGWAANLVSPHATPCNGPKRRHGASRPAPHTIPISQAVLKRSQSSGPDLTPTIHANPKRQRDAAIQGGDQGDELAQVLNLARVLCKGDSGESSPYGDVARALLRNNPNPSSAESAFLLGQAMTALPEVGGTFLSFRLIAELGHGSFGRVYLARQGDLANRLVALKITIDLLGEEQKLAQLQHTNVVPIYSVHQAGPFQAVCMPYFGATTLADVIRDLQGRPPQSLTGKDIVHTVRGRQAAFRNHLDVPGTVPPGMIELFEQSSYIDAVLHIAESVAEGLMHAHERGILHRDLKPANILVTDEGRPMLVDFNLSADVKLHTGLRELQVGGTLPYMSPEHLQAMRGSHGTTDARSDLYALGVVLFELLTGRLPFDVPAGQQLSEMLPPMIAERLKPPPSLRRWNPAVSPALESIIRQCLQPDPARRYQSAEQFHDDIRRQRQHRPLRYAPEPSLRERAGKWAWRHPRLTAPGTIAAALVCLALACTAPIAWQAFDDMRKADELRHAEEQAEAGRKIESEKQQTKQAREETQQAREERQEKQARLDALSNLQQFDESAPSSRTIMEIVSVLHMMPEAWPYEEKRLADAVAECRQPLQLYQVLDDPHWQQQPRVRLLPAADAGRLRIKIAELLYALAHAEQANLARLPSDRPERVAVAALTYPGTGREICTAWNAVFETHIQSAARLNELARGCFPDQAVPWYLERQKLAGELRPPPPFADMVDRLPPNGEEDERYWAAIHLAAEGQFQRAVSVLTSAVEHPPDHSGAWLLLAWCHHNLHQWHLAQSCYEAYFKLEPESVWGHYGRGLTYLAEKNWSAAERDFSAVLRHYGDLAWGYAHRASARGGMGNHLGAIRDLTEAIDIAPQVPEFYYLRAQQHFLAGNRELAELDRRRFLSAEPSQYSGWLYRGLARRFVDPRGALADFDRALSLHPHDPLVLINKARVLTALDRTSEAAAVLDLLIEQNPNHLDARGLRGLLRARGGQRGPALEDADRLLKIEPTPARCYEAASILALTSRQEPRDAARALQLLRYALRHGHGVAEYQTDPNLRPLAHLNEFRGLAVGLKILGAGEGPP